MRKASSKLEKEIKQLKAERSGLDKAQGLKKSGKKKRENELQALKQKKASQGWTRLKVLKQYNEAPSSKERKKKMTMMGYALICNSKRSIAQCNSIEIH